LQRRNVEDDRWKRGEKIQKDQGEADLLQKVVLDNRGLSRKVWGAAGWGEDPKKKIFREGKKRKGENLTKGSNVPKNSWKRRGGRVGNLRFPEVLLGVFFLRIGNGKTRKKGISKIKESRKRDRKRKRTRVF